MRAHRTPWGSQHQNTGRSGVQGGQGAWTVPRPRAGCCQSSSSCRSVLSNVGLSDQHPIPGLIRCFGLICSLSLLSSLPHGWLPDTQPFWQATTGLRALHASPVAFTATREAQRG